MPNYFSVTPFLPLPVVVLCLLKVPSPIVSRSLSSKVTLSKFALYFASVCKLSKFYLLKCFFGSLICIVSSCIGLVTLFCNLFSKRKRKSTNTKMLKTSRDIWKKRRSLLMKSLSFSLISTVISAC